MTEVREGMEFVCELPESAYPYSITFFRGHLVAVNEELGCFLYDDDQCWKKCIPESNNVLVYHPSWYFKA